MLHSDHDVRARLPEIKRVSKVGGKRAVRVVVGSEGRMTTVVVCRRGSSSSTASPSHVSTHELLLMLLVVPQPLVTRMEPRGAGRCVVLHLPDCVEQTSIATNTMTMSRRLMMWMCLHLWSRLSCWSCYCCGRVLNGMTSCGSDLLCPLPMT